MIQKTQNMLDITDLRPMADHLYMFQHVYREWHEETDRLTHLARELNTIWNFFAVEKDVTIKAMRSCFQRKNEC